VLKGSAWTRYTLRVYLGALIAFYFGAIIGSFLNVVVLRLNSGRTLSGRSQCFSCGRALTVIDLVPLLSYVALRGRCRGCGSRISLQYPLVELLTGFLFAGVYLLGVGVIEMAFLFILISFFVAISVYDLRHKIIPDTLVYPVAGVAFLYAGLNSYLLGSWYPLMSALLSGIGMALPLYLLWKFSGGKAMGLGDSKLALAIGLTLAPSQAISAFVFSFWAGAFVGVLALFIARASWREGGKSLTIKSEIPFAPFLILAWAIVTFLGIELPTIDTFFHAL